MKTTKCAKCPADFEQPDDGRKKSCPTCRSLAIRETRHACYARNADSLRDERNRKRRKKNPVVEVAHSIVDVNRMARKSGLSYGEMVARMRGEAG